MRFYLKKTSFLAILILTIAILVFGNVVLAKKIEINDKDVQRIKNGLSLLKTFTNLAIQDNTIKTALNTIIKGGETGTDITYGLVVLSAMNEMDFIDMVVSQRYKKEATAYFNQIVDEKTNLMSYYKSIGYDLPRAVGGNISGSMSALTLNSFSIIDKVISIFSEFNVIKQEKIYDGLWYYFSLRRENKESHGIAWEDAKIIMGWAVESNPYFPNKLDKTKELESQFATLWDKWGPYTDSSGVTMAAKEQFGQEMTGIVSKAIEEQALVQIESGPSFLIKRNYF